MDWYDQTTASEPMRCIAAKISRIAMGPSHGVGHAGGADRETSRFAEFFNRGEIR